MGGYVVRQGQRCFLYEQGNVLYFQSFRGNLSSRPVILCRDYSDGLSDICHNGTVYYCYCDLDGNMVMRSVRERSMLHFVPKRQGTEYSSPVLILLGERLCLLYICRYLDDSGAVLNCIDYQTKTEWELVQSKSVSMRYQCLEISGRVVVGWLDDRVEAEFFELCRGREEDIHVKKLLSDEVIEENIQKEIQERQNAEEIQQEQEHAIRDLQETLLQERQTGRRVAEELEQNELRIQKLEKNREVLQTAVRELEEKSKEQEQIMARLGKENREYQSVLDSVKRQYEELMDTAVRYRDEAVKWRNRCRLGKHA